MEMLRQRVRTGEGFLCRLPHGADLLQALNALCETEGVRLGRVEAIGAVRRARIGYYDQTERTYRYRELDEPLEILHLLGNVSLKDGAPMVHAHVALADAEGRAFGGHLAEGTPVFACEAFLQPLEGEVFERVPDEETGLPLWAKQTR